MESAANASCPKCLDQTVECDYFDGKRICLKCGFVLEDEDLVPSDERDAEGQTTTHYVPPSGIVPGILFDFAGHFRAFRLATRSRIVL